MGRIVLIAVAVVLLTAAPAAQASLWSIAEHAAQAERAAKLAEDAAKAAKAGEATVNGAKIEGKVGGIEVASTEVNGVKVEPGIGGGGSESGAGEASPPTWFTVLFWVAIGGCVLWRFRGKLAG